MKELECGPQSFETSRHREKRTFQLDNARPKPHRAENNHHYIPLSTLMEAGNFFRRTAFEVATSPSRNLQRHLRMQYILIREVAKHIIAAIRF